MSKLIAVMLMFCSMMLTCPSSATTPVLLQVSPTSVKVGSPGFKAAVTGRNFRPRSVVLINKALRQTVYIDPAHLTAAVLSSDVAKPGLMLVQVATSSSVSGTVTITIVPAPLVFVTPACLQGQAGVAYGCTFQATGGVLPYKWTVAAGSVLPPGLALSTSGVLSGTPTTPGSYSFVITVTDSAGTVTQMKINGKA